MQELFNDVFSRLQLYQWLLVIGLVFLFIVRMVYVLLFFGRIIFHKGPKAAANVPVSLLMPLRNEEEHLKAHLPKLLSFENVDYEIVAVDDFSSDNSLIVLNSYKEQHENLLVSSISQYVRQSEKLLRNLALKAARKDWVLLIPPTANSFSPAWLSAYSSKLNETFDVAVGYSNLKGNGTFLNVLYRIESFFQQITSFGYILNGLPYVINETNVAFKKQKYFETGGYGNKIKEPDFNLELLINTFIQKKSTALFISGEHAVRIQKRIGLTGFFELAAKESGLRKYLPFRIRLTQQLFNLSSVLFLPVVVAVLLFIPELWPLVAGIVLVYAVVYSVIIKKILHRLDEPKIFLPSLMVALLRPFFKLVFRVLHRITQRIK